MPVKSEKLHRLSKVARNVYSVISDQDDSGLGANQGFVVLNDAVLVFDTGFSSQSAKSLDRAIAQVTDKKVKYIVNSHHHLDHVFGNSYFFKKYSRFGLNIISHEICARNVRNFGHDGLKEYKKISNKLTSLISSVEIVAPNITYSEIGMNLNVEGTEFVFIHPEIGAHTLGDTILAIPEMGVMFLGDVFVNSSFPDIEDANIEGWIAFLEEIDHETYSKFVPGHGKLGTKQEVVEFSNYMRKLCDRLLLSGHEPDRQKLRSCFEIDGTQNWKSRFTIDLNIDSLLEKLPNDLRKNLK